jgi:hypothetical protein
MDHVQTKNHKYQSQDEKKIGCFFDPHVHPSSTITKHLSWKFFKPKCNNTICKKCQILKLESEI